MKKRALIVGLGSAIFLSGCMSTNIRPPSTYTKVSLPPADIMPSKDEVSGTRTKVVIFNAEDGNVELAKSAKIGHSVASSLETYIAETGSEIVDRTIAQKLKEEIQLAEMKGKSEYSGPNIANYAITGTITTANVGSKFQEASQWQDKEGKWYTSPAKCTYSANVKGNLRIYKLPGLSFSKAINIDEGVSTSQETRNSRCPYSQGSQEGLVQQAASAAVKDARIEFQNYFAPKAYILERRQSEGENIFKLSRGKDFGFTAQSDISIFHLEESINPLTQEVNIEEYAIAEGTISNEVGQNHAWIVVDEEEASKIKLGDYVKVLYEKSAFESVGSLLKF